MSDELENASVKVIRRTRGEAVDVATSAGLLARVVVLDVDGDRVRLVFVASKEVRFKPRTRQEASKHARRRRA